MRKNDFGIYYSIPINLSFVFTAFKVQWIFKGGEKEEVIELTVVRSGDTALALLHRFLNKTINETLYFFSV